MRQRRNQRGRRVDAAGVGKLASPGDRGVQRRRPAHFRLQRQRRDPDQNAREPPGLDSGVPNEDKATRYHRLRRRASLFGTALGALVLLLLLLSGGSAGLRDLSLAIT